MIKKILWVFIVLWSCIVWITQWVWQWWNYTLPFEFTWNYSDVKIDENLNISNFSWWKIWLFKIQDYNNYIRWNEWKIYWYYNYWNTCRYQWELDKMCIGALDQARNPTPVPWICTSNYSSETAESFYNWEFGTQFETILLSNETNAQSLNLCFLDTTDNNTTYCLSAYQRTDKQLPCYWTFEDLQSNISVWDSPFAWGGGWSGWTLIPTSTDIDVAINYYETIHWFNDNMCYVWTNNLTADFWTAGISFEEWTWSTIFELYYSQFSWFGNNIITNVWKFINVWTLNYWQRFYERDNIKRLAMDNGPDNWVSYIYTWFTFPFANKPVAIFFMASNLLDWYFSTSSMWNDVAFYCYLKLNYSQIKEWNISYTWDVLPLVPPSIQNNIDDHFKYQLNYWNSGYYYSPDWIWSWTWDYELSDNLELDWVFTNFLNNFNARLWNIDFWYSFWIIPDWILYPLIFLILFRIMKH